MPSSSRHNTAFERKLHHLFIMTYYRVHCVGMWKLRDHITRRFAGLLEVTDNELLRLLDDDLEPAVGLHGVADGWEIEQVWQRARKATDEQSPGSRVWSVACHLLEVSAELLRRERRGEAEGFGELGMACLEYAEDMLVEQELEERLGDGAGVVVADGVKGSGALSIES